MKVSYPIGQRGEEVYYMIIANTYNCAKAIIQMLVSPEVTEFEDEWVIECSASAHEVVNIVERIEAYCDGKASLSYTIFDTQTQDWSALLEFENFKLRNVTEEAQEI